MIIRKQKIEGVNSFITNPNENIMQKIRTINKKFAKKWLDYLFHELNVKKRAI
jgi:Holliday junction resolvasome RuvABC DNA-binding subunit